jgi:pimeloyl-ACP methyl ester carboxylesterase
LGASLQAQRMGNVVETPVPHPEAVELPLPWGPVIRGFRWGGGPDTVLLVHEPGSDVDAWGTLPVLIARRLRIETVALDLPGHGLSDDPWDPARLPDLLLELSVGIRVTHDGTPSSVPCTSPSLHHNERPLPHSPLSPSQWEMGPGGEGSRRRGSDYPDSITEVAPDTNRRFIIAAGMSATTTLALASELQLSGLISLAPEAPSAGWNAARSPTVPKLFVAGSMAGNDLEMARRLSTICGGWSVVTALPVAARGTALLASAWGGQLAEEIVAFLRDRRRPAQRSTRVTRTMP